MLDPGEASKLHLEVNMDKNELSKSFHAEEDRLTVAAFDKTNNTPFSSAMFKKTLYNLS